MSNHANETTDEYQHCLDVLRRLADDPDLCLDEGMPASEVADLAALLLRRIKAVRKKQARHRDQELVDSAKIRRKRTEKEYGRYLESDQPNVATGQRVLDRNRSCYVCKQPYIEVHPFYDAMCVACGQFNFAKRSQSADLSGRTIVVTGARIKIGFQIALKLLRAGANVIATTRFPRDAAFRYCSERDAEDWRDRLRIYSADFRSLPTVNQLCDLVHAEHSALNGLINNAAQTVRRPPQYYRHLIAREARWQEALPATARNLIVEAEAKSSTELPSTTGEPEGTVALSALLSQATLLTEDSEIDPEAFPDGQYDLDGQQIDARQANSWSQPLGDVQIGELLEVHAVNAFVPFLLIQRLEKLLDASVFPDRYVVNVTAMEGQFNSLSKPPRHPHTNMAKAGMNMITRTCAEPLARRGIYMNSVDTGWITNEFPLERTLQMQHEGFEPPLDEIDGASRVLDPLFVGVATGTRWSGKFLKDYRETVW